MLRRLEGHAANHAVHLVVSSEQRWTDKTRLRPVIPVMSTRSDMGAKGGEKYPSGSSRRKLRGSPFKESSAQGMKAESPPDPSCTAGRKVRERVRNATIRDSRADAAQSPDDLDRYRACSRPPPEVI